MAKHAKRIRHSETNLEQLDDSPPNQTQIVRIKCKDITALWMGNLEAHEASIQQDTSMHQHLPRTSPAYHVIRLQDGIFNQELWRRTKQVPITDTIKQR